MRAFFRLLLRAFPPGFREAFGSGMLEASLIDYRRARAGGRTRALLFVLLGGGELVISGIRERLSPTWAAHESTNQGRWQMTGTLETWTRDLLYAARNLRRAPGFTLVAVGTLGLAIGANAGIFSVLDAVVLDPLPYQDAGRLVHIGATGPGSDLPDEFGVSMEFFVHYREESRLLEEVALYNSFTNTLRVDDRAERVRMSAPSLSAFGTLGVTPILGRLPTAEDEGRAAVLSHGLWTDWFGADPSVLGRSIDAGGDTRTVVGVMGPDFWFPDDGTLLWIPQVVRPTEITPGRFGLSVVGRLAPDATPETLAAELTRLALRLPERFGGSPGYARFINENHRALVRPLASHFLGDVSAALWILLGSVAIVLLIACANVANLFVARAERRQQALAVRTALGAGRAQLVRSMMSEAVLVALMAGGLAVVLAWLTVPLLLGAAPPNVPRLAQAGIAPSTLLFTLCASLLCALLCGFVPALRASATDLARLREAGRGSTRRAHRGRNALVVVQTALALVLLIGSALLVRSFVALGHVDPGYETEDLLTFQFAPEQDHLTDAATWAAFHMGFMDRLRALPGVESVGIVENVPLDEGLSSGRYLRQGMASGEEPALLYYTFTGGDYFEAMGIELLQGRPLTASDNTSELGNVVVSRSAADLLWPGEDPIGRRIRMRDWGPDWETVVGVVEDVLQYGFRDTPQPMVYYPLVRADPNPFPIVTPGYVVKSARAEDLAPEVRELVRQVAPEAPVYRVYTMESLAERSMNGLSFTMLTLGVASVLSLVLGAVGLFGVLSYVVAERTKEIGLRMALGAQASEVRRMVVAQGGRVALTGVGVGLLAALGVTRVLERALFGVEAVDVPTFAGMSLVMLAVALLASYLPARRASSVDPIRSLGTE